MLFDCGRSKPTDPLRRAAESDYNALRELFDHEFPEYSFRNSYISRLLVDVENNMLQAQFNITTNRLLGMFPFDTRIGDEIYILAGGNIPFVLRPYGATFSPPGTPDSRRPCYTLVGNCYLDQFMIGEHADKLKDEAVDVFII